MKKLTLKQHCLIGNLIMIGGVLLAIVGACLRQDNGSVHFLVWTGLVVVLASVIYKSCTLKCPHCGSVIPARYKLPGSCPGCGKPLSMEEHDHEEIDT